VERLFVGAMVRMDLHWEWGIGRLMSQLILGGKPDLSFPLVALDQNCSRVQRPTLESNGIDY